MDNKEDKLIKQIRKRLKELRAKKKKKKPIKKKAIKKKVIKKPQPLQRQTQRQEVNIILGEELKTIRKKRRRTTPRPKAPTIQTAPPVVFHSIPQLNEVSSLKNTFYDFQSRIEALDDRIKTGFTVGNETLNSLEDKREIIQERQRPSFKLSAASEPMRPQPMSMLDELKKKQKERKEQPPKQTQERPQPAKKKPPLQLEIEAEIKKRSERNLEDKLTQQPPIRTLEEELKQPERAVSLEDTIQHTEAQEAAAEVLKEIEKRMEQQITERERQPDPVIREQLKKDEDEEPSPGSFGGSPVPAVPISQQEAEDIPEAPSIGSFPPAQTTPETTGREAEEKDEPGTVVLTLKKGDYTAKYNELNPTNKKKFKDNYKEFFKDNGEMYANTTIIKYKAEADRRNNAEAFLNSLLEGQAVRSEGQKKRSKKKKKKKN